MVKQDDRLEISYYLWNFPHLQLKQQLTMDIFVRPRKGMIHRQKAAPHLRENPGIRSEVILITLLKNKQQVHTDLK